MSIKFIQIYGERSTGTNYLHHLLEQNIKGVKVGYKFGWKHGFAKINKIKEEATDSDLILVITKEPYSWLVSMYKKPHHAPQMLKLSFSEFLREEWACYEGKNFDSRDLEKDPLLPEQEMMFERNPDTNERFGNVIRLRESKMRRLLRIKDENIVKNIEFIRYEDLLLAPRKKILSVADNHKLKIKGPIKLSSGYFGKNPSKKFDRKDFYLQKQYLDGYKVSDLKFTNSQLDEELEARYGYEAVHMLEV